MFDTGVDSPLDAVLAGIRVAAESVDVEGLDVTAAARVVEQCAEAERVLGTLRIVVGAALKGKAVWRREGFGTDGCTAFAGCERGWTGTTSGHSALR